MTTVLLGVITLDDGITLILFSINIYARIDRDIPHYPGYHFYALGLLILEGYGLTESCGASTLNLPDAFRFGTVGRTLPGVEVSLAPDSEILLRGRSIASRCPEAGASCQDRCRRRRRAG